MKKVLSNLKTSDKITFLFSIFNFVSLLILLLTINIIYFFIWYSDQKKESWYDMNTNYNNLIKSKNSTNIEAFKKYILKKNTLIIPNNGDGLICSDGVAKNIHDNVELIKDKLIYNNGEKIFFIYTKKYPEIGEVKILFDTTPYVKSQIIIIKISFFIILFSLFFYIIIGKRITRYGFRDLEKISKKASELDIEKDFEEIEVLGNSQDEINILANKINNSFFHIKTQTNTLKQFITDVSHEFKTPLMVINSKIDLYNKKLEKNKLTSKDTEYLLENIKEKTKKLDDLLDTFLFLSRVENKLENLDKLKINFSKYLKNCTKTYLENNEIIKNIGIENIEIKYKIEKNIFLNIEQNTFNILFGNLLSNAVKFGSKKNSTEDNPLKLEIGLDKNSFYIKDNGIGIKKEDLNNIFYKFFRSDKKLEGFGIGLFLVKRLCYLYDFEIKIESELGKGTKFIINYN